MRAIFTDVSITGNCKWLFQMFGLLAPNRQVMKGTTTHEDGYLGIHTYINHRSHCLGEQGKSFCVSTLLARYSQMQKRCPQDVITET
jgi:hypothetical protein